MARGFQADPCRSGPAGFSSPQALEPTRPRALCRSDSLVPSPGVPPKGGPRRTPLVSASPAVSALHCDPWRAGVRGQFHTWPRAWPPRELQPRPLDEPNTNGWASVLWLWRGLRALKCLSCQDISGLEIGFPPQLCGLDSSLGFSKKHFVCKMWITNSQGCSED